ncbi:MAG: histidinol dehydrogenase [Treponemataceae bacterium]|nr:histidinol dehydrogenase [Treponemataceae bacterium]
MIKIIKAEEIPESFYRPRVIEGSSGENVHEKVLTYIERVKKDGDKALHKIDEELVSLGFQQSKPESYLIPQETLKEAADKLKKENAALYEAVSHSYKLAFTFAKKQRECFTDFEVELEDGLITGQKTIPVETAGLYVPAGRFPLFSSLVMCAAPAKAAGCAQTVLCTPSQPAPDGSKKPYANESIMASAYICGIDKVFALGGAQAIAAMAYGTQSVPRCNVIAGPGNKYVAEAKRTVFGDVGIDMVAGPTEAFIIADDTAKADWVAADMLAQAEHDPDAQAILVTFNRDFADKVSGEIEKQLSRLPTEKTARTSIERNGLIVLADSLEQAASVANNKAPEHLELALDDGEKRDKLMKLTHNYGTLFVGHAAAEVLGDYAAGLNHILPTSGAAKYTGGLSVRHFLKTVTTLRTEEEDDGSYKKGVIHSIETAAILGDTEGLAGHAAAARIRKV